MKTLRLTKFAAAAVLLTALACSVAQAGPVIYFGQDDGASSSGPWPNSAAA